MLKILQGAILKAYLAPLEGCYTGSGTAENDLVARLVEENLDGPERRLLKIVTVAAGRFCYTDPIPIVVGKHLHNLSPE